MPYVVLESAVTFVTLSLITQVEATIHFKQQVVCNKQQVD